MSNQARYAILDRHTGELIPLATWFHHEQRQQMRLRLERLGRVESTAAGDQVDAVARALFAPPAAAE